MVLFKEFLSKVINYKLARRGLVKPANPVTLTFSVTIACQSLCKTCGIGRMFQKNPKLREKDLKLDEIEKIFKSIGHIYFFNISGGEPYLRKDLPQIVELACKYLSPGVIHIPTNAIASEHIRDATVGILEIMRRYNSKIPLTVKPSIDGIGEKHDEIRGVRGNFKKLLRTIELLKEIQKKYNNFYVELGTVVSNFNINDLSEIEDFVHSLGVESYRNEIAEQRTEFFNIGDPITPDADTYEKLIREFSRKIKKNINSKRHLTRITESFRLVYYNLVVKILRKRKQVIPCYAGISNVHINHNGEVWPCCVLGYDRPMGHLRECNYDFQKLWHSEKANRVRKYIKDGNCACPLANQAYSNILCHFPSLIKVFKNIIFM